MSVETVAIDETAVAETEESVTAVPREPITDFSVLTNNPAIRVADSNNPQDESLDKWYVLDTYRAERNGNPAYWTGYVITDSWDVGVHFDDRRDPSLIMEVVTDYSNFLRIQKLKNAVGMYGAVYAGDLPRDIYRQDNGNWPFNDRAFFEILEIAEDGDAKLRIFSHSESPEGDWWERGVHTVDARTFRHISYVSKSRFDQSWGLAKNVVPMGTIYELVSDGELKVVTGYNYSDVKLKAIDEDGKISGRATNVSVADLNVASYYAKVADSFEEYQKAQPDAATRDMLMALSINTVSSALKHADKNDYCSETAVALASAGHSLPELRIKGTITMEVDVTTKEYMVLRKLMGLSEGRADELLADMFNPEKPNLDMYRRLASNSRGQLPAIDAGKNTKLDLNAQLVWKAPRIRK